MKKITDYAELVKAKHALNKTIAPVEDGANIAGSYTSGKQFIRGGVLYTALTTIAANTAWSSLTLDTDYELADDLTSQLASLNQTLTNNLNNAFDVMSKNGAKNLLLNKASSQTVNGITFTVNSDKTITASGTASENAYLEIDYSAKEIFNLPNGNYILSGGISSNSFVFLNKYNGSTLVSNYLATNDEVVVPLDKNGYTNVTIGIGVNSGQTLNNVVFKPMLRLASDIDNTYEPYSMTNREMTPYVQAISNPNLLDNPWFTVNQRGQISYSFSNRNNYCFDRWISRLESSNLTITKKSNYGITLNYLRSVSWFALSQIMPEDISTALLGKNISVEMLLGDITNTDKVSTINIRLYDASSVTDNSTQIGGASIPLSKGVHGAVITLPNSLNSGHIRVDIYISTTDACTIDIDALKLELGSVSTLAQDTAPNYQQELAKCQRYFLRLPNTGSIYANIGFGVSYGDNALSVSIPTPVTMRALPTVTSSGNFAVRGDGKFIGATIGISSGYSENSVTLDATTAVTVTQNVAFALLTDNDSTAYIDFSANL